MPDYLITPANQDKAEKALADLPTRFAVLCYSEGTFMAAHGADTREAADEIHDTWVSTAPDRAARIRTEWFGSLWVAQRALDVAKAQWGETS